MIRMKGVFTIFLSLSLCSLALAQDFPPTSYFEPYAYPASYARDGAYHIMDFGVYMPRNDTGYGGYLNFDFASIKLGTPALRLNFGGGLGLNNEGTQHDFEPTPLADGSAGSNHYKLGTSSFNLHVYPRLWIRVFNPINLSLSAGPAMYFTTTKATGHYTSNYRFSNFEPFVYKLESAEHATQFGHFIDLRVMVNFSKWGIHTGITKHNLDVDYGMQTGVGLWLGLNRSSRVNSEL